MLVLDVAGHVTEPLSVADRLAVAADCHGLWVKDAARFDDVLSEFGLSREDINPEVIEQANRIHRSKVRSLVSKIDEWNTSPIESVPSFETELRKEPVRKPLGKQAKLFGQSITAVIRWMGKQGDWKVDDVAVAVLTLTGKQIADATIRIQLKAGRDGQRGEPAKITSAQAKQLREASK